MGWESLHNSCAWQCGREEVGRRGRGCGRGSRRISICFSCSCSFCGRGDYGAQVSCIEAICDSRRVAHCRDCREAACQRCSWQSLSGRDDLGYLRRLCYWTDDRHGPSNGDIVINCRRDWVLHCGRCYVGVRSCHQDVGSDRIAAGYGCPRENRCYRLVDRGGYIICCLRRDGCSSHRRGGRGDILRRYRG